VVAIASCSAAGSEAPRRFGFCGPARLSTAIPWPFGENPKRRRRCALPAHYSKTWRMFGRPWPTRQRLAARLWAQRRRCPDASGLFHELSVSGARFGPAVRDPKIARHAHPRNE